MSQQIVTDQEIIARLHSVLDDSGVAQARAVALLQRTRDERERREPPIQPPPPCPAALPVGGSVEGRPARQAFAFHGPTRQRHGVLSACDILMLPNIVAPQTSALTTRLRDLIERFTSPFAADGQPIMMASFKDAPNVGIVLTARFVVEGEDARLYTISGKVKGSRVAIIHEGDRVRIHEDGHPVVVRREFRAPWKDKVATGLLWLGAVHLTPGQEFTMWLNNGQKLGDIDKRAYVVAPSGLVCTLVKPC